MFYELGLSTIDYLLTPPAIRANMMSPACQVAGGQQAHPSLLHTPPQVFPTVTSCQFPTGSLTGTVNIDHALCVLRFNTPHILTFLPYLAKPSLVQKYHCTITFFQPKYS